MKTNASKNIVTQSSHILALTLVLAFASLNGAPADAPKKGAIMVPGPNAEHHSAMKEHHEKMMTEMKAQDTELAKQIAAINSAQDINKMGLVVTALTTIVEQRAAMHESMSKMMTNMMDDNRPMKKGAMSPHPMMKDKGGKLSKLEKDDE